MTLPRIALAESASASFVSRHAASADSARHMGKATSSMTGRCVAREGSLRRRARFVCKEGAALDRAYGRPVQAAWLFSAAQNGGRYLRPHRPQVFQVAAADGPGRTIHCVRLPPTAGQLAKPLEHKGLSLARTMRTVRTVSARHLLAHW
jgi:hypothetical protein